MRSWWPIHFELGLASNLVNWGLVSELSDELISLDVDVLFALGCLGSLHIASEELFGRLRSLLLQSLRVILALVGLKELVRVGACRDDHCSVSTATVDTLIVHDVRGQVLLIGCVAVGVLILLFLGDDARVGCKALPIV